MTKGSTVLGVAGLVAAFASLAYLALGTGKADPQGSPSPSISTTTAAPKNVPAPPAAVPGNTEPARASAPTSSRAVTTAQPASSPESPASGAPTPPRPSSEVSGAPPPITSPVTLTPVTPAPAIQSLPAPPPAASAASADAPRTAGTKIDIKKDAVIGVRLDHLVATDSSKVDDKVTARVARDVVVDGRTAIPAGARLEGIVTLVERGGPSVDRGRIGVRFHTLLLGDNQRMSIQTDTIFRESEPNEPLPVGARAAVGAAVSNAARKTPASNIRPSTAAVPTGHQVNARIQAGSLLTVKLTAPVGIDSGGRW